MSPTSRILLLGVTENSPCGFVAESGFTAESRHVQRTSQRPLSANSGHNDLLAILDDFADHVFTLRALKRAPIVVGTVRLDPHNPHARSALRTNGR
jgi:hypothetical protein